jgi:hypothetical protein
MNDELEWSRWTEDFHAPSDSVARQTPEALLARTRYETRRQLVGYVGEVLASVGLIAFYIVMMRRERATWFVALASANFAFAALWIAYLTYVRRGTWRAAGNDTRVFVELAHARAQSVLRWFRFAQMSTAAMLLFVVAWAPFMLRARWELYCAEPWRAIVGFGVAFAIATAVMVYYARRVTRAQLELHALDEALAQMRP